MWKKNLYILWLWILYQVWTVSVWYIFKECLLIAKKSYTILIEFSILYLYDFRIFS